MNKLFKRERSASDLVLLLVNLIPVAGVWLQNWNATEIFLVYCLESVIIGIFVLIKLWIVTIVRKKDDWNSGENGETRMSGYFFMLFFLVHYGFFIAIQLSIFLEASGAGEKYGISNAWGFVTQFNRYLPPNSKFLLEGFVVSYGFITLKDFVLNGTYKTIPFNTVMFEPYGRIFIQQFTVILGSLLLGLGADKIFITVFAAAKIFFEIYIDFKTALSSMGAKKSVSTGPEQ